MLDPTCEGPIPVTTSNDGMLCVINRDLPMNV